MKPFTTKYHLTEAYQFLSTVQGDCSILVRHPVLGPLVHLHTHAVRPVFRALYGPITPSQYWGLPDPAWY